ncbi:MAG: hypothetical protein R6X16_06520 [Anaerolineae bacterium]
MTDLDACETKPSIGRLNERSLHAALKAWCSVPGDRLEVTVDGYVVDVVREGLLIEVQTRRIAGIQDKLLSLAQSHDVRLVYPVIASKTIVTVDLDGETVIRTRRSPGRQVWGNLFDELVYCPKLLQPDRLELLAVRVAVTEVRCADGLGAWRRKRVSIRDTQLDEVLETRVFCTDSDLLALLPESLECPFTHRDLASVLGVRLATAQRASYCLRQLGLLQVAGRQGRALLLERVV